MMMTMMMFTITMTTTRNSSRDEIANLNLFLYDIVHALQNTMQCTRA